MGSVEYRALYAGHGAINYMLVRNDSNKVIKKIIVDAGTTGDGLAPGSPIPTAASNEEYLIQDVKTSDSNQVIICVTHIHEDHYSYVGRLITELKKADKLNVIDTISIGSVVSPDKIREKACKLYEIVELWYKNQINLQIMGNTMAEPKKVWEGEGIQLWLLFNCLCVGKDENANSANYAVKSIRKRTVFWFTGDSTGNTFNMLLRMGPAKLNKIKGIFDGCAVVMTVPHHGSITTFIEDGFINEKTWKADNWQTLCKELGINEYTMVASFGVKDMHRHPSGVSMSIYASMTPQIAGGWGPNYLAYYRTELGEKMIDGTAITGKEGAYIQRLSCRPYVYVTCKFDGTNYDTSTVTFTR